MQPAMSIQRSATPALLLTPPPTRTLKSSTPCVFWDFQDVMLEDVERIEVIRGPGATLWGANAVAELQETFALSDAENLERAAHKLKSAAAVFDARGVVETAQR